MNHWNNYLVRVGLLGHVGRFSSSDGSLFPRGAQVVCRTRRGLEVGEVLSHGDNRPRGEVDGTLIRRLTIEDRLLLQRLEQNRQEAFSACERLMVRHSVKVSLVDVEQLFDGQSIYFYFLGEITRDVEKLVNELSSVYESQARLGEFATALQLGCGPDCGTESAAGCGTSGCDSCASNCGILKASRSSVC